MHAYGYETRMRYGCDKDIGTGYAKVLAEYDI